MNIRTAAIALALSACATSPDDRDESPTDGIDVNGLPDFEGPWKTPGGAEEPTVEALVTDLCDEPTYTGTTWKSHTSAHFALSFPGGSAPDADHVAITERLEAAYADIRTQLGISAEPSLLVNLSPSRVAAEANGKGTGTVWPNLQRYDVVYTGVPNSFEMQRYGQLMTKALDFYMDSQHRYRVPMLAVGVAELLDQSGRNLHDAYAKQLIAGAESRVRIADVDLGDVWGGNPGRAGSLVQFLVDRYGMEAFVDIYRATAVNWDGSCEMSSTYGCIDTPDAVKNMLDGVLQQKVSEHWADVQPLWRAQVEDAMARMATPMDDDTIGEISNVLRVMDKAISTDSAFLYRTTMEGFYCDWGGGEVREEIATRAVAAYGAMKTTLLGLYDTGTKNFPTVDAFVMRVADGGTPMFQTINFEHLPVGWRVTYSPDWY